MPSPSRLFFGTVVVGLFAWLCLRISDESTSPSASDAWLIIPNEDLDLGEVWADSDVDWQVSFYNPTSRVITCEDIRTSCKCTSIDRKHFSVGPGENESIRITLDLSSRGANAGVGAREFRIELLPTLRQEDRTVQKAWILKGRAKSLVSTSKPTIEFGVDPIEPQVSPIIVNLVSQVPLKEVRAVADHPVVEQNIDLESATTARLQVGLREGWFHQDSTDILVNVIDAEVSIEMGFAEELNVVPLSLRIPVKISLDYDVEVIPSSLSIGPDLIGSTKQATVLLRSRSGRSFSAKLLSIHGDGISAHEEATTSQAHTFAVSSTLSKHGQDHAHLKFSIEDDRTIPYFVQLHVNRIGVSRKD